MSIESKFKADGLNPVDVLIEDLELGNIEGAVSDVEQMSSILQPSHELPEHEAEKRRAYLGKMIIRFLIEDRSVTIKLHPEQPNKIRLKHELRDPLANPFQMSLAIAKNLPTLDKWRQLVEKSYTYGNPEDHQPKPQHQPSFLKRLIFK